MNTIAAIARKHGYQDIVEQFEDFVHATPPLHLGVLGEFSSGKSSLINSMLGRTVLPAMERPTTANVVEIHPEAERTVFAYSRVEDHDGKATEVSLLPSDLSEWVMGRHGVSTLVIRTPPSDLLRAGWRIVDTPGISSLEQMHQDITFGYLPRLDGAIVCIDINQGGCTRSLLDFLAKPEVALVADTFLFALTRADTVPPEDAEIVRRKTVTDLEHHFDKAGITIERLDEKVVVVSPRLILEGKTEAGGQTALWNAIRAACYDRMEVVAQRRVQIETGKLCERLIERLLYRLQALNLDATGFAEERLKLMERQADLRAQREQIEHQLNQLLRRLADAFDDLSQEALTRVTSTGSEQWSSVLVTYTEGLRTTTERETAEFFQDIALPDMPWLAQDLGRNLESGEFMNLLRLAVDNLDKLDKLLMLIPHPKAQMAGEVMRKLPIKHVVGALLDKWQAKQIVEALSQSIPGLLQRLSKQVDEVVKTELLAPAQSQIDAAQKDLEELATREKQDSEAYTSEKVALEADISQAQEANIQKP